MKIPLIFICTITLLQIPSYATSGIFGDDEKIEELNKKIDVLEKANKEQSVDINSLRLDVKKLNEQLNKNNKELLEADVRSNLAIMELDDILSSINVKPIIPVADDKYVIITTKSGLFSFRFDTIKKYGSGSEIKASVSNLCSVTQSGIDIKIEFLNDKIETLYTAYESINSIYGGFMDEFRFRVPKIFPEELVNARISISSRGMSAFKMKQY